MRTKCLQRTGTWSGHYCRLRTQGKQFSRLDNLAAEPTRPFDTQCPNVSSRREVLKIPVGVVTSPSSATNSKVLAS